MTDSTSHRFNASSTLKAKKHRLSRKKNHMIRGTVLIDQERCKGCNLCTSVCPQGVLVLDSESINARGYHPALLVENGNQCTGCMVCAVICPDVCITVLREPRNTQREGQR